LLAYHGKQDLAQFVLMDQFESTRGDSWGRAANNWRSAMNQYSIFYEDRFMKSST
jgi:transposase-like protein